jgi:hypothetical protein
MDQELREQIRGNFEERESEELLELWRENDRDEYSAQAFEVVREILIERGVELPEQEAGRTTKTEADAGREGRTARPGAVYIVTVVAVIKAVGLLLLLLISATIAERGLDARAVGFMIVPALLFLALAWGAFRMKVGAYIAGIVYAVLELGLVVYMFAEGRLYLDDVVDVGIVLNAVVDLCLIALPCLVLLVRRRRMGG